MPTKNSILLGGLGKYSDQLHTYQPPRDLAERLAIAARIPRAEGVEPVYPQDLGHDGEHVGLERGAGLAVSTVNVDIKGEDAFRAGAATNPDPCVRPLAVDYMRRGMDLVADLGAGMVSACPLIDGSDHPFHVDHLDQWR